MNDLADVSTKAIGTDDGELFWFQEVASHYDLTPPVIEDPQPWVWNDDPPDPPPLGVLLREIAQRLHGDKDVTGWLYSQREFEAYAAAREAQGGPDPDLPPS